ncbi:photosystem II reaction center W protein, chloroplastic-like [Aristolochia californica]|uniref:photosystem II reaction center W protein, chloroplastic-like n=1 Tax=Aristolochia californica TaxID=171875 RepID=UPI0035D7184B
MATVTARTPTSSVAATAVVPRGVTGASSPHVLGLPAMVRRGGRVRCSTEEKPDAGVNMTMGASLLAAASAVASSGPALALVDERLSTEGTGLSLGVSNNLLGWILLGVFALIWALYFVYTSTLEEDEESGLSL